MKSAQPKLPSAEPRIPSSVKAKRSTATTEDRARMKTVDELLKLVINEAKAFGRPAHFKSASKKTETV
jgi:hypothetical protein